MARLESIKLLSRDWILPVSINFRPYLESPFFGRFSSICDLLTQKSENSRLTKWLFDGSIPWCSARSEALKLSGMAHAIWNGIAKSPNGFSLSLSLFIPLAWSDVSQSQLSREKRPQLERVSGSVSLPGFGGTFFHALLNGFFLPRSFPFWWRFCHFGHVRPAVNRSFLRECRSYQENEEKLPPNTAFTYKEKLWTYTNSIQITYF